MLAKVAPRTARGARAAHPPARAHPAIGEQRGRVGLLLGCVQRVFFPDVHRRHDRGAGRRGLQGARARAAGLLRRARAACRRGGGGARARPGDDRRLRGARRARHDRRQRRRLRRGDEGVRRAARHPRGRGVRRPGRRRVRVAGRRRAAGAARAGAAARRLSRRLPPRPRSGRALRAARAAAGRFPSSSSSRCSTEREICCGSAGIYNLVQPRAAAELGARKARHLLDTGAQAIAAGNPGCAAQLDLHLRELGQPLPIHHPVELVWRSIQAGGRTLERARQLSGLIHGTRLSPRTSPRSRPRTWPRSACA